MLRGIIRSFLNKHSSFVNCRHIISAAASKTVAQTPVYSELKYTKEESEKVLQTVNMFESVGDILRYDISKGRADKIRIWKSKNGPFANVEQLLELDGFGSKILDKFVASILDIDNVNGIVTPRVSAPPRTQQFTTPSLNDRLRVTLKTCTAIHVGVSSVTWTQLSLEPHSRTKISNWASHPITDKKVQMYELVDVMWPIIDEIPESDVYLLEMPRVAMASPQGTPAQTNINVQLSQTIAMISLALAKRCRAKNVTSTEAFVSNSSEALRTTDTDSKKPFPSEIPTKQLLFLRQYLASRLFQTVVGTERVSTESIVADLMQNRLEMFKPETNRFIGAQLQVNNEFKSIYELAERYEKEYLGQSLLMALAFVRLSVIQCPDSLAIIYRRGK